MVQSTHGDGTDGYPDDEGYDGYEKRAYQGYGRKMGKRAFEYPDDEGYIGNEKRAYQGYGRKMGKRDTATHLDEFPDYEGYDGYEKRA